MTKRARQQAIEAPVEEVFATTQDGRDITRGYVDALDLLKPQDEVLLARGRGDWKVYEELLRDDQVKPTFEQRRLAVVAHEWCVESASEDAADVEAADWIRELLKELRFDDLTKKMLSAVFFGFAVAECIWGRDGDRVTLEDVRVRKQRRFRFSPKGELVLLTTKNPRGEVMPERKFWVVQSGADDDDEPYGRGLGHHLYWPVFFKRNGLRYWHTFLDKFGDPTVLGKYPAGATAEEKRALLELVRRVRNDSGLTMPDGVQVSLLESARSAGGDFGLFCDRTDAAISKIVLGQTMTTDDGSSLSQSKTHLTVRDQLIKADADMLCESFNRSVIAWLCDWNFPTATPPKVWRRFEEQEDLSARATRDVSVSQLGYRPTIDEIREIYGGEWEPIPAAPAPVSPGGFDFAEAPRSASTPRRPTEKVLGRLDEATAPALDAFAEELQRILDGPGSLEEMRERLYELEPTEVMKKVADQVAAAVEVGELLGRAEVIAEVGDGG